MAGALSKLMKDENRSNKLNEFQAELTKEKYTQAYYVQTSEK